MYMRSKQSQDKAYPPQSLDAIGWACNNIKKMAPSHECIAYYNTALRSYNKSDLIASECHVSSEFDNGNSVSYHLSKTGGEKYVR